MDELGIGYIYGPSYSPQFNGIEYLFSIGKNIVKKKRIQCILENEEINLEKVVLESFESIDVLKIKSCI